MENFQLEIDEIEVLENELLQAIGDHDGKLARVKELSTIVASTSPNALRPALEEAGFLSVENIYQSINLREVEVSTEKGKIGKIISAIIDKIIRLFEKITDINKSFSGKLNKIARDKTSNIGNMDNEKLLDLNMLVYEEKTVDGFLNMAGKVDISKIINKDDGNLSSTLDTSFVKIIESLGYVPKEDGIVPGEKSVLKKARLGDIGWDTGKVKNGVEGAERALIHIRKHTDTLGRIMSSVEKKAKASDNPKAIRDWIKNIRKVILWIERNLIIISKQMILLGNSLVLKK